jgi:hypothetical protein
MNGLNGRVICEHSTSELSQYKIRYVKILITSDIDLQLCIPCTCRDSCSLLFSFNSCRHTVSCSPIISTCPVMASQCEPPSIRKKIKAFFRPNTPRRLESVPSPATPLPTQSFNSAVDTAPNAPDTPPPPTTAQKAFTRSKNFRKDIAILSAAYILDKHPELKKLIHLIVIIHDKDEDEVMSPMYYAYSFLTISSSSLSMPSRSVLDSVSNLHLLPRPIPQKPRRR